MLKPEIKLPPSNKTENLVCNHQPINTLLSDAGIYSYAALCSICLHELYNTSWDQPFAVNSIQQLIDHLGLPKQVEAVMFTLLHGEGNQTTKPYIDLLKEEPCLQEKAVTLIQDLILFAVQGGAYDARMRVLAKHVAWLLQVPVELVETYEQSVVDFLSDQQPEVPEEERRAQTKRDRVAKLKRYAWIGLATLGGGAVIGLTGGVAAPLIGAGVGTLLGGGAAAALGSTAGIAIVGSVFGVAGGSLTGYKMQKRVGEIEEFSFGILSNGRQQLHVAIAISGWLNEATQENFTQPWRHLGVSPQQYYLRYETAYLVEMGKAIDLILNFALTMAAQEALKYTILAGIVNGIAWPSSLLTLASVIDNPWGVCCRRSSQVGKQLAHVLLAREHGHRPVTLVGYSLGARVIYYCLREMSQRPGSDGIIQDAYLLGAPVTGEAKSWLPLLRVVAGRLVNGFCRGDWLLKFLYRTLSIHSAVAGLEPIDIEHRRLINIDLSDIIDGHSDYPTKMDVVLRLVGVRVLEEDIDQPIMKKSNSHVPPQTEEKEPQKLTRSKSESCVWQPSMDSPKSHQSSNSISDLSNA